MRPLMNSFLARVAPFWLGCGSLLSQAVTPPPEPPSHIELGLGEAVHWKWSAVPSEAKGWGVPLPEPPAPPPPDPAPATATAPAPATEAPGTRAAEQLAVPAPAPGSAPAHEEPRPATWEVKRGDGIIRIARKFDMTAAQLKKFNDLKSDRIIIGQTLRIPTPEELLAMEPPPPPPPPEPKPEPKTKGKTKAGKKKDAGESAESPAAKPIPPVLREADTVLLQVFLDREMFSTGGIDGKDGPNFQAVTQLYLLSHPDTSTQGQLNLKALAAVKETYTTYVLRAEDFKFIKPPEVVPAASPSGKPSKPVKKPPSAKKEPSVRKAFAPVLPVTYEQLVASGFLGYTSVWEFLAERFHCNESFLRQLNPKLDEKPAAGTAFQVPNVIPFEIETALDLPLQPSADPQKPVTAAVGKDSLLKISQGGQLVAVMPLASARPNLRGRGSWKVLDAIPKPRLTTTRESREAPKTPPPPAPETPPAAPPAPASAQFLACGPNNPVGVLWIQLAKAKSTEPLPYGLHGTSIPGQMKSLEGIGGLRLTNWDIARAVRLMPSGTALQWTP